MLELFDLVPRQMEEPALGEPAGALLELLGEGALTGDELVRRSGIDPGQAAAALVELELARRVALEDGVYRVGGAQAIAALAYGTVTVPRVSKIVGPGNAYVAAAKRLVRGRVETDSEAGPSEVAVLADDSADAGVVAADLLAQAEHGSGDEVVVLVTPSRALALEVVRLVGEGARSRETAPSSSSGTSTTASPRSTTSRPSTSR